MKRRPSRGGLLGPLLLLVSCADKQLITPETECTPGDVVCQGNTMFNCEGGTLEEGADCSSTSQLCVGGFGCLDCAPESTFCCTDQNEARFECTPDLDLLKCNVDGTDADVQQTCSVGEAEICVSGEQAICEKACDVAARFRSYVGCEYYAVDMDNYAGDEGSAAAQQFAIVLSNPSSLVATVTVEVNNAPPGMEPQPEVIRQYLLEPEDLLEIDDLDPREVDGSAPGTFDTGTDTALTSNAFRIRSTAPVIAYQFNPHQRFNVFSNDASLLVPTTAVGRIDKKNDTTVGSSYLVMGWPQLLADTEFPETDAMVDLPALLTIVGTTAGTSVTVQSTAAIIGSPDVPATPAGGVLSYVLGPFDVLNLESDGFGEDFSGSQVASDKPVLVFSGNECTDVPQYMARFSRQCCCDHLEEQLFPLDTLGTTFVALQTPRRSQAIYDAGGDVTPLPSEKEYWRLLTSGEFTTCITSLPEPLNELSLVAGSPRTIEARQDFLISCTEPVTAGQFVASQHAVVGPNNNDQPAGDPAFMILPPIEQYRKEYLFLIPDKYAFDYLLIAAPSGSDVLFDEVLVEKFPRCQREYLGQVVVEGLPEDFDSIKCALSDPKVDPGAPSPGNVDPNVQNDGVHSLRSDHAVGLIVYGFDAFVSYGYPGGSDLAAINVQ